METKKRLFADSNEGDDDYSSKKTAVSVDAADDESQLDISTSEFPFSSYTKFAAKYMINSCLQML